MLALVSLASQMVAPAEARRVALVIGNSAYPLSPLSNPVRDASAVAATLKDMGFDEVQLATDVNLDKMRAALRSFSRTASGSDIALVFYAGHGTEFKGRNFLLPVDATLDKATDLDLEAFDLEAVLNQLSSAGNLKIVILDACRNNLFKLASTQRAARPRGLAAPAESAENMLVVYSAKEGMVADDGSDAAHSPFTTALLKHMPQPGIEVNKLFRSVVEEVKTATRSSGGGQQIPHVYGSLDARDFFLRDPLPSADGLSPAAAAWQTIEFSEKVEDFQRFLRTYSGTPQANWARQRLHLLNMQAQSEKVLAAAKLAMDRIGTRGLSDGEGQPAPSTGNEGATSTTATASVSAPPPEAGKPPAPQVLALHDAVADPGPATPVPADLSGQIKFELVRLGCLSDLESVGWDGSARGAVVALNKHAGMRLDPDRPDTDMLAVLRTFSGRKCPLTCGAGQYVAGDRCVAAPPPVQGGGGAANFHIPPKQRYQRPPDRRITKPVRVDPKPVVRAQQYKPKRPARAVAREEPCVKINGPYGRYECFGK